MDRWGTRCATIFGVGVTDETRKRLWGKSGNRCAVCRQELIRLDSGKKPGALVGQEAHIVARSPGGPRYMLLDPATRDGYDNLILLCASRPPFSPCACA